MSYILIIGAKSDVSKELARIYARNNYNIYLAARNSLELSDFANDLSIREKQIIKCLELDILDFESHTSFYNSLLEKPFGVISVVGYLGRQEVAEVDFLEATKIVATNYLGNISLLNIIANDFVKRRNGFIIGISSVAGDRGRKKNYIYGSSKAGFTAYLSGLRNRLQKHNVQVITVKPGFIATKMIKHMATPKLLTAKPIDVAKQIFISQKNNKDILYTKKIWRWIMLIIEFIPEWKFKKMNL